MRVIVVDDSSSGADLVAALHSLRVEVEVYRPPGPYVLEAADRFPPIPGDLVALCEATRPDAIIAGGERGVSLAEVLAHRFALPHNDIEHAFARRNKNAMMAAVGRAGVAHPRSVEVASATGSATDAALATLCYPVVVKPSTSGGSDMCAICTDPEQAAEQIRRILSTSSLLGHHNTASTVQEYVEGPQLFVNTVSCDGHHIVTEVFEYSIDETEGIPTIRAAYTVDPTSSAGESAVAYTIDCLDALGVRFGAGHTEVRMTDHGPRLIEFNGRMMGPSIPDDLYLSVRGHSQATVFAQMVHSGAVIGLEPHDDPQRILGWYMLSAIRPGVLTSVDTAALENIDGVLCVRHLPPPGTTVTTTNRVTTGESGVVFFRASTTHQARSVIAQIRALETADSVFVMEPAS